MDTLNSVQSIGLTGVILIDIAIGVIFAVLTFALISSAMYEAVAGVFNFRGGHLRRGIRRLLGEKDVQDAVLKHPLIQSLRGPRTFLESMVTFSEEKEDRMPSSIPKAAFAKALVEGLVRRRTQLLEGLKEGDEAFETTVMKLNAEIDKLPVDDRLRARLKGIVDKVDLTKDELAADIERKIASVETELANWFDQSMHRVTGWYVRQTKTMLFFMGFLMAACVNFDIIGYGQELAENDSYRNSVVARAELAVKEGSDQSTALLAASSAKETLENARADDGSISKENADDVIAAIRNVLDTAQTGSQQAIELAGNDASFIGWGHLGSITWTDFLRMFASWFVIGLGCTLGGQFWFDLLKNFFNVRAGANGLNSDIEQIRIDVSGGAAGHKEPKPTG